jgi:hypothetical protein
MREADQVEPASILNGGDKQYMSCRLSFSVINLYFNIFWFNFGACYDHDTVSYVLGCL